MKKLIGILTVATAFVLLVSCGDKKEVKLTSGEWKLVSMDINDATVNIEGNNPTMEFSDTSNKVFGFAGCNRYFATYTVDGSKLKLSQMGSTMMMCPSMDTEDRFLHLIANTSSYKIKGDKLTLFDSIDKQTAMFELVEKEQQ